MSNGTSLAVAGQPFTVTILIVAYNGRRYLQDCLNSVLDQDFPRGAYEVVVADNASRDGSADFVEQHFSDVRVLRFERNYGAGGGILHALPHVRGKYVAYLNQDIIAHRRWLAELVETIEAQPQVGLVESNMILPQWPEYQGLRREGLIERAYVCDINSFGTHEFNIVPVTAQTLPIPVLAAYCAGAILDPQIVQKLGYLVEEDFVAYADDLDIGLRLNAAGLRVLMAPRSVVYHNTDWHFKWDARSIRRAYWVTRNTILAFYKISYPSEFIVLFPRLLLGKLIKAGQHHPSRVGKVLAALAGVPLLLVGVAAALAKMPSYRERKRFTLSKRIKERGWLVDQVLHRNWRPDPKVWNTVAANAAAGSD